MVSALDEREGGRTGHWEDSGWNLGLATDTTHPQKTLELSWPFRLVPNWTKMPGLCTLELTSHYTWAVPGRSMIWGMVAFCSSGTHSPSAADLPSRGRSRVRLSVAATQALSG